MTPQEIAKSIADELREHPERWTQQAAGRDADGSPTRSDGPIAISWCLVGHFRKRGLRDRELDLVGQFGFAHFSELTRWNDHPRRSIADVIALCDEVARS